MKWFLVILTTIVFGASGTLLAHPPQRFAAPPVTTVRKFEVPQPDIVIPQPPRTFEERTTTYTVETTPLASVPARVVFTARVAYVPAADVVIVNAKTPISEYRA